MHRNVDQDESNPRREIDCWNSNRIYRRSQALFTSAGLIVRSIQGVDLAPILHKLPRGYPSCQLWLLCFVCLVLSRMRLLHVWYYNRYVILLPTQIITGFIRFFFIQRRRIIQLQSFITSIQNIQPLTRCFKLNFQDDQNLVRE